MSLTPSNRHLPLSPSLGLSIGTMAAVLATLTLPGPARAYINIGASLEWLCDFAPSVVLTEVSAIAHHKKEKGWDYESADVQCKVTEVLKGRADKTISFKFGGCGPVGDKGTRYLLFLDQPSDGEQTTYFINLHHPCEQLSKGVAYTKKGEILTEEAAILALVRQRLKGKSRQSQGASIADGLPKSLYIPAPGASENALYAGSSTFLWVPPDPEFKKDFLERYRRASQDRKTESDDVHLATALLPLSYYPDKDVIAILKEALADKRYEDIQLQAIRDIGFAGERIKLFMVRQAAYQALTAMKQKVARPEGYCPYFHLEAEGAGGCTWGFTEPRSGRVIQFHSKRQGSSD